MFRLKRYFETQNQNVMVRLQVTTSTEQCEKKRNLVLDYIYIYAVFSGISDVWFTEVFGRLTLSSITVNFNPQ